MITNKQIKLIKSLAFKKNRLTHQLFVVEGEKQVSELLNSDYYIDSLFATKDWIYKNSDVEAVQISNSELARISNQKNPNQVLALVKIKRYSIPSEKGLILVLDDINDPGNMGTIIRTCDWFGVQAIICSMNTVDSYNPKVVQSSMGSVFRMPIIYTDLLEYLQGVKFPVYGAFMDGQNVKDISFPRSLHLVVGNEAHGIKKEITQFISKKVKIAHVGKQIDSLNVAVATSILLYDIHC
ncbi:MAG: RNA methyltransferase [Bacteroidota bacterium]|nr:RNA methyltransferase [Bacteroidota bacterium]